MHPNKKVTVQARKLQEHEQVVKEVSEQANCKNVCNQRSKKVSKILQSRQVRYVREQASKRKVCTLTRQQGSEQGNCENTSHQGGKKVRKLHEL